MKKPTTFDMLPVRSRDASCCSLLQPPALPQSQIDEVARRIKAVADPTRLRLLDLLSQQSEPLCVCDITPQFSQNQPTISHHLKLLREAGLIHADKQGVWSYYQVTEEGRHLLATLFELA
ncbi:MAG: metalloregulator ArsR/SmtB family transcription factor [Chloroflexota bacterium]